jgi:hypothetical protein
VLVHPALPGERLLETASANGHMSSVAVAYDSDSGLAVVRTIRRAPPGQRVWPVHDLPGALASFAANAQMVHSYVNGAELVAEFLRQAEAATADEVDVVVAGTPARGRVLRISAYAAVDVRHEQETLVFLGATDLVGDVALDIVRAE